MDEEDDVGKMMDGHPNFLDLCFADDIIILAQSRVDQLDRVGLLLNADKAVVITNEAQLPQTRTTKPGPILTVLPRDPGQKWLGCSMLTSRGSEVQDVDLQYHLQQASKLFHMNQRILQDRNVSIIKRLPYFKSVVSSVACFAGGYRAIYNQHLARLDCHFRKFCRSIVGPSPGTDWALERRKILHQWNIRVGLFIDRANIKPWSRSCCLSFRRLAQHIATLPQERWARRILRWCPTRTYRIGRSLGIETSNILQVQRLGTMD